MMYRFGCFVFLISCYSLASDNAGLLSVASSQQNTEANDYGWRVSAEDTLSFSGYIGHGSAAGYQRVITNKIKNVIVNTGGGDVNEAIAIATDIYDRKLKVTVHGFCLSACANYFLPAAREVVLDDGFIGVHGNITSCVKLYGGASNFAKLGYGGKVNDSQLVGNVKNINFTIKKEKEFYQLVGLDPEYLLLTCRPDKGMFDGSTYAFLAPKVESLVGYGIKNVAGDQSYSMIRGFERVYKSKVLLR